MTSQSPTTRHAKNRVRCLVDHPRATSRAQRITACRPLSKIAAYHLHTVLLLVCGLDWIGLKASFIFIPRRSVWARRRPGPGPELDCDNPCNMNSCSISMAALCLADVETTTDERSKEALGGLNSQQPTISSLAHFSSVSRRLLENGPAIWRNNVRLK